MNTFGVRPMKTTPNPNDQVLQQAKGRAAQDGVTLTNDRDFERFEALQVRFL